MARKSDLATLEDALEALDELHGRFAGIHGRGVVDRIRRRFRSSIRKLNKLGRVNFPPKAPARKRKPKVSAAMLAIAGLICPLLDVATSGAEALLATAC